MTDSEFPREFLQLALYPTAGRITSISNNEVISRQQRTCLFLNLFETQTETNSTIGIQFSIDADTSTGAYLDFDPDTGLNQLSQYPQAVTNPRSIPDPIEMRGKGQVISSERISRDNPGIYPTIENREPVALHMEPVTIQDRTGLSLQFGTTEMEGAEITLTPYQTRHIAQMLAETLRAGRFQAPPSSPERGVVGGHGTLNPIDYDTFTRGQIDD